MRDNLEAVGADWLAEEVEGWTEAIDHETPADYNERVRYLPDSVTPRPGFMSFDVNPYMREIVDCADPRSPVREVNLLKGVQITYTTALESVLLYYIGKIKTRPSMLVSADRDLAKARIENYILPMLQQSDMSDVIQSTDEGNGRKTGKTANHLQWLGGGFLIPGGGNNADKMRMWSILLMLKDEIDAWPITVGRDGDPDELTDGRCAAFWESRKIFRGSTPLISGTSKIYAQYLRGDQRQYHVRCKHCDHSQPLRWEHKTDDGQKVGGFYWDLDDGVLIPETVRYKCRACGGDHFEHDKTRLFSPEYGAEWVPTARPEEPGIRSYDLPGFYSPAGFKPWSACVADYRKGWDEEAGKVKDSGKYQVFYNNVLARPFTPVGDRVNFSQVSSHRRAVYRLGEIPNTYAAEYSGSRVLFLTCQVDVHKSNLAVAVMGWCRDARPYLIDYWRIEDEDCTELSSPAWAQVRELIEEKIYVADDGRKYRVILTFIDASYANDTVTAFCADYAAGVFPILGRERPAKNQRISEFAEFTTQAGTVGYRILVDHYKDRMGIILRRQWVEEAGPQKRYHFNAPVDLPDKPLRELTAEIRTKKTDERGTETYFWHRPGNKPNELFDLLGYGFAAVEVLAWSICIQHFELKTIDWAQFWDYVEAGALDYQP